ncbi:biotin transporter BioY [candidate division WOR-3 bacterium]|nr:biotin transporter BioY [candidate division WOR-3 bacterium]
MTFAGVIGEKIKYPKAFFEISLLITGTLILAVSAQINVRTPISPVPFTFQTMAVLLLGAALGSKRGAFCIALYIFEGLTGLPVFAGGLSGFAHIMGPTGGYLLGFIFAAYAVGYFSEKKFDRNIFKFFFLLMSGNFIVYFFGMMWLGVFTGYNKVFALGAAPFILPDLLKTVLSAFILPLAWRIVGRR